MDYRLAESVWNKQSFEEFLHTKMISIVRKTKKEDISIYSLAVILNETFIQLSNYFSVHLSIYL